MKKLISLVLAALMALTLFAACGKSDNGDTTDNNDNAEVTGTISTDGSTSMEKVIMSLGEAFQADNKGGTDMVMAPGMIFTIEPMVNMGKADIYVDDKNNWEVYTDDGLPSAQWEIMVLVTEDGHEVLSW